MPGFQVWHRHGERYRKVAEVDAGNVEAAAILTAFRVETWPEHPAIRPEPGDHRATDFGDIVIDPAGVEHRFEMVEVGGGKYPGFTRVNAVTEQLYSEFMIPRVIDEAASIGIDLTAKDDHPRGGREKSDYDRMLDEASSRGNDRSPEKGGPER